MHRPDVRLVWNEALNRFRFSVKNTNGVPPQHPRPRKMCGSNPPPMPPRPDTKPKYLRTPTHARTPHPPIYHVAPNPFTHPTLNPPTCPPSHPVIDPSMNVCDLENVMQWFPSHAHDGSGYHTLDAWGWCYMTVVEGQHLLDFLDGLGYVVI